MQSRAPMPACVRPGTYVPRQTHDCDAAVLVRRHLPGFLARLKESGQRPLPEFVKAELERFAGCGDFETGFPWMACRQCGDELRVPFSCKGRGFCPSCMGRRMAEGAALLVDHVLPKVGCRRARPRRLARGHLRRRRLRPADFVLRAWVGEWRKVRRCWSNTCSPLSAIDNGCCPSRAPT